MKNRCGSCFIIWKCKKNPPSNNQICHLCLLLAHLDPQGYVKDLSYNPPAPP